MKIVFLIHNLCSGGSERATCALANYFCTHGNDVTVITIDGSTSFYKLEDCVKIKYLNLPAISKGILPIKAYAVMSRFLKIRKSIKMLSPDVIIGMSHIMSFYSVFTTLFSKTRSIGTERSNPYSYQSSKPFAFLRCITSIFADGFVHQTEKARDFFPKSTYRKSIVIPNAIFNPLVYEVSPPSEREKTITAMGRLSYVKGFDLLVEAFSKIQDQIRSYKLIIYGEGEEKTNIERLISEKHLVSKVELAGAIPEAIKDISTSSVFVLSSRYEGMPNALMEAMACGVPCVSTSCQMGPEELIDDGVNGLLVPVEDPDSLGQAILKIINCKPLSEQLTNNALELRISHSPETICKVWLEYCKSLINH